MSDTGVAAGRPVGAPVVALDSVLAAMVTAPHEEIASATSAVAAASLVLILILRSNALPMLRSVGHDVVAG